MNERLAERTAGSAACARRSASIQVDAAPSSGTLVRASLPRSRRVMPLMHPSNATEGAASRFCHVLTRRASPGSNRVPASTGRILTGQDWRMGQHLEVDPTSDVPSPWKPVTGAEREAVREELG